MTFQVFPEGDPNTLGEAQVTSEIVELDELGKKTSLEWTTTGQTNPMRLRWLVTTAIKVKSTRALTVVDLKDSKFDVRVQVQSKADKLTDKTARDVVEAYYQNSELAYESKKSFKFGPLRVSKNALPLSTGFTRDTAHSTSLSGASLML